ncbi:MAG: hypothetical protein PWP07_1685 [Epulopiscium sp.]|jgi:uncharacterized protein YrzB (UPF0473 family)|uniref:DUF1292 domain-containing protein n=1 Tax=Defluviitalea raffinosedens TaxID=1450156 RepID=UPI0017563480|nr:DUF1292 domain-containing protein [Defluviitalea raffinosedens]MBM7686398.1 uncharacterized protein YrzB (UPF0473 family) [Defluviitalea raffinosedens]MBZ4667811.1 hypothetical protein [Defluviitaleaceae bacterium]MDK2788440.1 hypothetical protein [Candidatus Epulonipiscium sp.]HHW67184.1 DUF1292 domain-containing protein [Candidatus Epulonipiscium sp.]
MSEHDCGCNHDHEHDHAHDHDCGCDHTHDEGEVIYLTLDDDTELKCDVVGTFEVDNKDYIALLPEGEDQVLLYGYREDEEGLEILNIDDDAEFDRVSEAFMDEFSEFIDGEDFEYYDDEDFEEDEEE